VKKLVLFFLLLMVLDAFTQNSDNSLMTKDQSETFSFNQYFENKTLRVDYYLAGNDHEEIVYFREMKREPQWGGNPKNLIDPRQTGSYRYLLKDSVTGILLFSRGFCSLFQEWQGTTEAKKVQRAFPMAAVMPFPKHTVIFIIERRKYETGQFESLFSMVVNPLDYFIIREMPVSYPVKILYHAGESSSCLDIAFISEGYMEYEMPKFLEDAIRMTDYFLVQPPYNEFRDQINFYAIQSPSQETGVDIPGQNTYVNTCVNSSFYTWDMDRYLTTFDTKGIYDIAASVPYDAIFILNNSSQYGGGGFYNHYGQSTVDNALSEKVAIHEFGHSFAGLADEYYASEITYSDFYNLHTEPWEPNITTHIDFDSKWKSMIPDTVPIPTPREVRYQATVGMFEGGGYVSKGVFSPMMDCRMKGNAANGFCPVCQEAIRRMIRFYCD
jgi:hypothetical protein